MRFRTGSTAIIVYYNIIIYDVALVGRGDEEVVRYARGPDYPPGVDDAGERKSPPPRAPPRAEITTVKNDLTLNPLTTLPDDGSAGAVVLL